MSKDAVERMLTNPTNAYYIYWHEHSATFIIAKKEAREFTKSLDQEIELKEEWERERVEWEQQLRNDMLGKPSMYIDEHMKIRKNESFIRVGSKNSPRSPANAPFYPWIKLTRKPQLLGSPRPNIYSLLDRDLSYKAMDALLEYFGEKYPPERWHFTGRDNETMLDELWLKRIIRNTVDKLDEYTCTAEEHCSGRVIMTRRKGDRLLYAYCYEHIPIDESEEEQDAGAAS